MAEEYEIKVQDATGRVIGTLEVEKAGAFVPAGPHRFQYKITALNDQSTPLGTITDNRVNTFISWDGEKFMYPDASLRFGDALTLATKLVKDSGKPLDITNNFYLQRSSASITRA